MDGVYNFLIVPYPILESCASGTNGSYDLQMSASPTPLTELTIGVDNALLAEEYREGTFEYDLTLEILP